MIKDLTNSKIERQNILNNELAIEEVRKNTKINGISFENKLVLTKNVVADFFEVDIRTINRYLTENGEELKLNGYEVLTGKRLKDFIAKANEQYGRDINVLTIDEDNNIINAKTSKIGIFDFRAFLNIAMLLSESENAKTLRNFILDIVIDIINQRTGGGTKYINQRDEDFISAYLQEDNYRKEFTDALRDYVDMDKLKYPLYTDKIYVSIFKEDAKLYREILKLKASEKVRDTFYSEILDLVASYECGLAELIKQEYEKLGRKIYANEMNDLFTSFENLPHWKPLIIRARSKMASRDLAFRDALHLQLKEYITPVNKDEYDRFLGDKSKDLQNRLQDAQDVLKRLKDRD